ncbi:MAG: MbcA/ParS/Xre antitoxin family protein [Candidatus Korobacteraceae bacterium]
MALLKQKESLSEEELLERVRLQKLMLHLEVRLESLAQNLGTNWQRVRDQTQPAKEYADVLAHAVETFGSRTNANAWLNKPNRLFHNQTPLQILTEDPAAVEEELVRIDHGMFI